MIGFASLADDASLHSTRPLRMFGVKLFNIHTRGLTRQGRAGVCHFIIYFVHIKRSFCSHLKNICCRIRLFLFSFSIFANPFILFKAGSFGYGNEKLQLNRATTIDFQQPKQTYFMLIREWIATINCCDVQHAQQNINQLGIYASVYCVLCSVYCACARAHARTCVP